MGTLFIKVAYDVEHPNGGCRKVLMFHHFSEEGLNHQLVASAVLDYTNPDGPELDKVASQLFEVSQTGYAPDQDGVIQSEPWPPVSFAYPKAEFDPIVHSFGPELQVLSSQGRANCGWCDGERTVAGLENIQMFEVRS